MMHSENYEQWFKLNKNMMSPLSDFARVTSEIAKRSAQEHCAIIGENLSILSDQFLRFSQAKKPEDFLTLQRDCLNEHMTMATETIHKWVKIHMQNLEECAKLIGSLQDHNPLATAVKQADRATKKTEEHYK